MKTFTKQGISLALSLVLTGGLTLSTWAAQFVDTSGHWAQQAIDDLSTKNVITGYPSGEFRPEGYVTRAEFATMMVKALHLGDRYVENGSNFRDVTPGFWGYQAIETVSDNGLLAGYPGGVFKPNQRITKAEATAALVKSAGLSLPNSVQTQQILQRYPDAYQVPAWAAPATAAAIQSNIYASYPNPNLIQPTKLATRAEVAVMTDNLQNNQAANTYPQGTGYPNQTSNNYNPNTTGYGTPAADTLHARVSVVPASTIFGGIVSSGLSSDQARVGDPITLTLDRPLLSAAGEIVIPQGSQARGTITSVETAGRAEKSAALGFTFNQITTPDGRSFPLSAQLNTTNGLLQAGTTKGRLGKIALRTGAGAAIGGAAGAVLGRVTGGKNRTNEGALWGSVIGAGLGAASAVTKKGNEVVVEPGEVLELRLRQPLTISY